MKQNLFFNLVILLCTFYTAEMSYAHKINWVTDWVVEQADSLATGTVMQNDILLQVTYTGHINHISQDYYWSERVPPPYTGNDIVDNRPTSGISLSKVSTAAPGFANVITFSSAVTDPLFALYSVGSGYTGVPYEFDQNFTLLSEGFGNWGDGTYNIEGDTLTGYEFHGVIQFHGMVSTISWNNPVAEYHHGFAIGVIDSVVSAITQRRDNIPGEYYLGQNFPNPFNPSTKITFTLPESDIVILEVYNSLGQRVGTLAENRMNAGTHDVQFDASNMPSGIYFYRLQAGKFSQIRKMVLLR